jgi:hypothetical protein
MKLFRAALVSAILLGPSAAQAAPPPVWGPSSVTGGPDQSCGIFAKYRTRDSFACSATIVAPDMAISSAHCFSNFDSFKYFLKCGGSDKRYRIRRMQGHPDYKSGQPYPYDRNVDLMLIYLDKDLGVDYTDQDFYAAAAEGPFDLSRSKGASAEQKFDAEPIPFAPAGLIAIPTSNADCLVAGWGLDKSFTEGGYGSPRSGKVFRIEYDPAWPDKSVLTYGYEGANTAKGDSGGGLLCRHQGKYYLVAVTIGGYPDSLDLSAGTSVIGRLK